MPRSSAITPSAKGGASEHAPAPASERSGTNREYTNETQPCESSKATRRVRDAARIAFGPCRLAQRPPVVDFRASGRGACAADHRRRREVLLRRRGHQDLETRKDLHNSAATETRPCGRRSRTVVAGGQPTASGS